MKLRSVLGVAAATALATAGVVSTAGPVGAGVSAGHVFTADGTWTVPENVCEVTIRAWGGNGGDGFSVIVAVSLGGAGGAIEGTFPVTPGDVLDVHVGRHGTSSTGDPAPGGSGYTTGGTGDGNGDNLGGGGGGGSSAVVDTGTSDVLLVAGGGGGGGSGGGVGDGGNGGAGANDGQAGSGNGAGSGGVSGDPNTDAGNGGNGSDFGAGGGAGSAPGDGVVDDSGGGGGGASAASSTAEPFSVGDPGANPNSPDGQVEIVEGEPGVGCAGTLAVAKVVSGTAPSGFTAHVVCTVERTIPASVGTQVSQTETVVDSDLPYSADGTADATKSVSGWTPVQGVWVTSGQQLIAGGTCTVTETVNAGATSTTYACAWSPGLHDNISGVGCPGSASGPDATPATVVFEGNGDVGLVTITNTFPVEVQPNFTG